MDNFIYTYTIIIPHKNSVELLQRCLSSIPRRKDLQIIIVDDNSDENKVDFENFPGLLEANVEVYFTKEGKGAGYARNVGLQYAKGKWLFFVDADDYLVDNFFSVVDTFSKSENDIIYFKLVDNEKLSTISSDFLQYIDIERGVAFNLLLHKDIKDIPILHNIPVGKMIRHQCVKDNHLYFDEIPCANDVMFFTKLAFCIHKIDVSKDYLYCISKPTDRNLTSRRDFKSCKTRLQVLLNINEYLQKNERADLLTSPLNIVWKYRYLGVSAICNFCWMIVKSTTPFFVHFTKFLHNPFRYFK